MNKEELKEKLKNIYDYIYYIYYRIKDLKMWFVLCLNRPTINYYKTVLSGYPFDFGYMYIAERAQLITFIHYMEKSNITTHETYEHMLRWMHILVKLLDIIIDDSSLYHFEGELEFKKDERTEMNTIEHMPDYHCDVYVNTKNADRFIRNEYMKKYVLNQHMHELYLMKCRYLYHMIRYNYMEEFWD